MIVEHKVSHRQACKAVHISSSTHRYKKKKGRDEPLITLLQDLVEKYPAMYPHGELRLAYYLKV